MRNESDAEAGQRMLLRRPAGMERQPAPEWDLSPVREDRDPAPPPPPPSATPSALYRTAFAQECEAIVLRLGTAAQDLEAERLSPLESACAFPGVSFTPAPPPPQPARSRGAEGAAPPRLSSACVNLTYEADDDDPTTSPLRDEARPPLSPSSEAAVAASSAAAHRTYERELPGEASALLVVTSTPLAVGPGPPGEEPQDAAARGPAGPESGSVGRPKLSCSFKARLGAPLQRGPRATPKSHGLGGPARGAAGALRGGKGAPGKAPQRFAKGGTLACPRPSLGATAGGGGSAAQGQPPAQQEYPCVHPIPFQTHQQTWDCGIPELSGSGATWCL
ncbi:translation initiation factor IF-2-like isoform X2 [Hemicordylus capensis]|uniref:translation initiation factor IF-2-like isoform X2 n=1 Tax=Hemicordylus capensis TaxID=884348 RepID=UPI0023030CE9|nr:translation initiation factor IF-2-like isoform X2 [Hemicordylus capensis]